MPTLALYYSPGACSLGPHIALKEAGIPVELRRVVVLQGEHKEPPYLAVNPRGRIPALDIDGQVATEGPAIMAFIAGVKPEAGLLAPEGTWARAKALEWTCWLSSSLHVAFAQFWRSERFLPPDADHSVLIAQGRLNILAQMAEVEAGIVGPWLLGERFGIADAYLLAFYRWGVRIGIDMAGGYPRWTEWKDRMVARPSALMALAEEGIGAEWTPA